MRIIKIAILLLISPVLFAHEEEYLSFYQSQNVKDYRLPKGEDLSYWGTDTNTYFYKIHNKPGVAVQAPYWTSGLFNNDSIKDYIFILFRNKDDKAFVVGFISDKEQYQMHILGSSDKYSAVRTDDMKKEIVNGSVKNHPKEMVQHFHLEGHGEIFYWQEKNGTFTNYK